LVCSMFVSFQFPLCDVRAFVTGPTNKLASPAFPIPKPHKDFVRGFGLVHPRRRGGLEHWVGEHVYCDAAQAIKFDCALSVYPIGISSVSLSCVLRRFFSSGGCVSRIEIGFRLRSREELRLDAADCLELIKKSCEIPVSGVS